MGDSGSEGISWCIAPEFEYFEGAPTEKIGHDGDRKRVQIA